MIRTLFIIAGAGLVLATACFGGVLALGGRDLMEHGWNITIHDDDRWSNDWSGDSVHVDASGPDTTRTLEWTGGETLTVDVAADVVFTQADEPRVHVVGPSALVDRLVLEGGRLRLRDEDGEHISFGGRRRGLRVTIAAPNVRRFALNGSGDLDIRGYDQDLLEVTVRGSGDVEAAGRTGALTASVSGSGDMDLGGLSAESAVIEVAGSGGVEARPIDSADVTIRGSGDVRLLSRPRQLSQRVEGSGDISLGD